MFPDERVLVTGAGGFIGGWLAEALYLSGGAQVRAGIRSWASAARLARFPLDIALCDIMDLGQARRATDGMTCVIHCAKGPDETIVAGTQNVLEAALGQGIRRFVYLSTAEVYGNPNGLVDETFSCRKTGNPYGDAKIEAEKLCWAYHARGLPVSIVRPSIVYGPFSKTWTVGITQRLQSGNWGIFEGYGDGICNLIYIADLVSGIMLAARAEQAAGEVFNLNGPETLTWNQYFRMFNAALGLPDLRVIKPTGAGFRATLLEPVRISARVVKERFETPVRQLASSFDPARRVMKALEHTVKTSPRATDLRLYNRQASYVATKAEKLLGFKPRFPLAAGLELTLPWLYQVGLVVDMGR